MSDDAVDPLAYLSLVPKQRGPWDEPGWSCCGDRACPFRQKCADIERLDAAFREAQKT